MVSRSPETLRLQGHNLQPRWLWPRGWPGTCCSTRSLPCLPGKELSTQGMVQAVWQGAHEPQKVTGRGQSAALLGGLHLKLTLQHTWLGKGP